ncbi:MAG: Ig-like domain-containing protein, partial [Clostridia bacterium]|nr:Ig-like domain-containing protein [Clostridia bacterium]
MRFNLASAKPGTVELSKTLSLEDPADKLDSSVYAEYPYQVFYREGAHSSVQLASALGGVITWSSSNEQAASVDANGLVTGIDPGTATITAANGTDEEAFDVSVTVEGGHKYLTVRQSGEILESLLDDAEHLLGSDPDEKQSVNFKDSSTIIPIRDSFCIPGSGASYEQVFLLKAGQTAIIDLPERAAVYRIVECGVNTAVYSKVRVNNEEISGKEVTYADPENAGNMLTAGGRLDYMTAWASPAEVSRVVYDNEIRKLRTLTIKNVLYDVGGNVIGNISSSDSAEFSFRLYLATEYEDSIDGVPANMQPYHVKDPNGDYCLWDGSSQCFVSLGKSDFSTLTDAEKISATFNTSMNGAIARIRAGYTVEVRDLLPGTQYRVEERPWDIPDGYSFKEYMKDGSAAFADRVSGSDTIPGVVDTIASGRDCGVQVHNFKGFGLRVNKTWTDEAFMQSRDNAYFAVFTVNAGDTLDLVAGSMRSLPYGTDSAYWYYDRLPAAGVTSGADGIVPKLDETLPAGVYELREKDTSAGYRQPESYIRFSVDDQGIITLISA